MKTMNRLMLKSYKCFEPQVVDIPEPKKGEVLVKVSHLGVCGSDISAYYGKQPYIPFPIVLGHELSGWVEKVGPDTEALPVGTRVTVLPHVPCRHCKACAEQRYNHCMKLLVIGCQTTGAQAEYLIAPADMIFELPESITMEQGAMVEPMAVTYHGMKKGVRPGDNVLIMGAGGIGLFAMEAAFILGAKNVYVADFSQNRLDLAMSLGATGVFNLSDAPLADHLAKLPEPIDLFSECEGGNGDALDTIMDVAERGVRVVNIGVLAPGVVVKHLPDLSEKEFTFYGSNMFVPQDFRDVIANLAAGKYKTDGIVTHRVKLLDVPKLFEEVVDQRKEPYIKLMILIGAEDEAK